jgi:hypothetical protein
VQKVTLAQGHGSLAALDLELDAVDTLRSVGGERVERADPAVQTAGIAARVRRGQVEAFSGEPTSAGRGERSEHQVEHVCPDLVDDLGERAAGRCEPDPADALRGELGEVELQVERAGCTPVTATGRLIALTNAPPRSVGGVPENGRRNAPSKSSGSTRGSDPLPDNLFNFSSVESGCSERTLAVGRCYGGHPLLQPGSADEQRGEPIAQLGGGGGRAAQRGAQICLAGYVNVAVIVPSAKRAKFWTDVAAQTLTADNIRAGVEAMKAKQPFGLRAPEWSSRSSSLLAAEPLIEGTRGEGGLPRNLAILRPLVSVPSGKLPPIRGRDAGVSTSASRPTVPRSSSATAARTTSGLSAGSASS